MGNSKLYFYIKHKVQKKYVMELKIFQIRDDPRYRDGVKYSLVFVEPKTGRRVLMDNHFPKGHHIHLDDREYSNVYISEELLIEKFRELVFSHFGVVI